MEASWRGLIKVISWHLPEENEENHDKLSSQEPVSGQRLAGGKSPEYEAVVPTTQKFEQFILTNAEVKLHITPATNVYQALQRLRSC
jgi:hypothetical protein